MRCILALAVLLTATTAQAQMRWANDEAGIVYALLENLAGSTSMQTAADDSFSYEVPAGMTFELSRANVRIADAAVAMPLFGGIAVLTDGLDIIVTDASNDRLYRFNTGIPIKRNSDWSLLAGVDAAVIDTKGSGDDTFFARWTIAKTGAGMLLDAGWKFKVVKTDDLSDITQFEMMLQGFLYTGTKSSFEQYQRENPGGKSGGGKNTPDGQ